MLNISAQVQNVSAVPLQARALDQKQQTMSGMTKQVGPNETQTLQIAGQTTEAQIKITATSNGNGKGRVIVQNTSTDRVLLKTSDDTRVGTTLSPQESETIDFTVATDDEYTIRLTAQ